jgi:hypothetical protein
MSTGLATGRTSRSEADGIDVVGTDGHGVALAAPFKWRHGRARRRRLETWACNELPGCPADRRPTPSISLGGMTEVG